jgi:hypothetical protein
MINEHKVLMPDAQHSPNRLPTGLLEDSERQQLYAVWPLKRGSFYLLCVVDMVTDVGML